MTCKFRWFQTFGVMAIGLVLARFASPAFGEFVVPESCPTGTGAYSGDVAGNSGDIDWEVVMENGETQLNMIVENELSSLFADTTHHTILGLPIRDDGTFSFTVESELQNVLRFDGTFGDCTMSGTWRLTRASNEEELAGDFSMVQGPIERNDNCGLGTMGAMSMTLTMMFTAGGRFRSRRRRGRSRRDARDC